MKAEEKNPAVAFVVGLAGSGKSTYAKRAFPDRLLIEENFWSPDYSDQRNQLLDALAKGRDCVVTEIAFCLEQERTKLLEWLSQSAPDATIEWIFFENDLDQANNNCKQREANKETLARLARQNVRYSLGYSRPEGAKIVRVWRGPRQ